MACVDTQSYMVGDAKATRTAHRGGVTGSWLQQDVVCVTFAPSMYSRVCLWLYIS